jgi:hypothetical protein
VEFGGVGLLISLDFICSVFFGLKKWGGKTSHFSRKMRTGLLGLLQVRVCTVLRLLVLGQSTSGEVLNLNLNGLAVQSCGVAPVGISVRIVQ